MAAHPQPCLSFLFAPLLGAPPPVLCCRLMTQMGMPFDEGMVRQHYKQMQASSAAQGQGQQQQEAGAAPQGQGAATAQQQLEQAAPKQEPE